MAEDTPETDPLLKWIYFFKEDRLEEGLEKGREEERAEGLLNTAMALKQNGISSEIIQKYTGLSQEKIDKL